MDKDMLLNMIKEMTKDAEYWQLKEIRSLLGGAMQMIDETALEKYGTIDISESKFTEPAPMSYDKTFLIMQKIVRSVNGTIRLVTAEGVYYMNYVPADKIGFVKKDDDELVRVYDDYGNKLSVRKEKFDRVIRILDALRGKRYSKYSYKDYYYYMHPDAPLVVYSDTGHIGIIAPFVEVGNDEKVEGDS